MGHDGGVSNGIFDVLATQPFVNGWHSHGNVLLVILEVDVGFLGSVSEERLVIKMPVRLPATTSSLVVVSKSDTFDEWIVFLMLLCEVITINLKKVLSFGQSLWVFCL